MPGGGKQRPGGAVLGGGAPEPGEHRSLFFLAAEPSACSPCKFLWRAMAAARPEKEPVVFQVTVCACQLQLADRVRAKPPSASAVAKHVGLLAAPTTSASAAQRIQAVLGKFLGWPSLTQEVQAGVVARLRAHQRAEEKTRMRLWFRQKRGKVRAKRAVWPTARCDGLGGCAVAQPACGGGLFGLLRAETGAGRVSPGKERGARVLATFSYMYMRHVVCSCVYILRVFQVVHIVLLGHACPVCNLYLHEGGFTITQSLSPALFLFACRAEPSACACLVGLNMSVLLSLCTHLPQVGAGVSAESPVIARSALCSRFHGRV